MTDKKGETQMEGYWVCQSAGQYFEKNYPKIIGWALDKINKIKKKVPKQNEQPKKGHHVINKGVNDLYKDIIKDCLVKIWSQNKYNELKSKNTIDKNGYPTYHSDEWKIDIPGKIKKKIDGMTVHKPDKEKYESKNALEFGCAKIIFLSCFYCVMQDIHQSLTKVQKMPKNFDGTLENLRIITASHLIEKNELGVYVDVQAKQWWDKITKDKGVFEECRKSVQDFLEKITGKKVVSHLGKWFHNIVMG